MRHDSFYFHSTLKRQWTLCGNAFLTPLCADLLMLLWNWSWHAEFVIHNMAWCNVAHFCGKLIHTESIRQHQSQHSLCSFSFSHHKSLKLQQINFCDRKEKSIVHLVKKVWQNQFSHWKKQFAISCVECGLMGKNADGEEMKLMKENFLNQGNEWKSREKEIPNNWNLTSVTLSRLLRNNCEDFEVCLLHFSLSFSFWSSVSCNLRNPIILNCFAFFWQSLNYNTHYSSSHMFLCFFEDSNRSQRQEFL